MTKSSAPPPARIEAVLGENRWAANRLAGLRPAERRLYAFILRRFARGQPTSPGEVTQLDRGDGALGRLVERDLIGLTAENDVVVAYPFSARPTRHRVRLKDGRSYWAMCAIDALGIPYLVHQAGEIDTLEPDSACSITITIDPAKTTSRWTPAQAVVVAARAGTGCSSSCACPHINVFASTTAADSYLAKPDLRGVILTVPEATDAGRQLFGDLLERLADSH